MTILILNRGSSTLKFALFRQSEASSLDSLVHGKIEIRDPATSLVSIEVNEPQANENLEISSPADPINFLWEWLEKRAFASEIQIVAHRIVHGGTTITDPTIVDSEVISQLEKLKPLAPLHMPKALDAITKTQHLWPKLKQALFVDTAFFKDLPEVATRYPIPHSLFADHGIRRFGFHGISHQYCTHRATELLSTSPYSDQRLIICHIGSGCSITAVRQQKPIDTTMGFTPLDGLMMATRSGAIDPGIMIYLQTELGWSVEKVDHVLNKESGLLGVSQISSDFRTLSDQAATNKNSAVAIEMFAERIRKTIGGFAVQMNGLDALVFTAGIGENSASLRNSVCDGLQCLGVHLDPNKNSSVNEDSLIQSKDSKVAVIRIATQEEKWIAQQVVARWAIA